MEFKGAPRLMIVSDLDYTMVCLVSIPAPLSVEFQELHRCIIDLTVS